MEFVADRRRNPFDLHPPCERFVPGYGPTDAHFHVVGDHPGVHGGLDTGVPFTDKAWSGRLFQALDAGGLVDAIDLDAGRIDTSRAFFSYIHACAADGDPSPESYSECEPYVDAELRAITAHVLLPVGERATGHVFEQYTAIDADRATEMADLHATDHRGSGWLIVPIADPAEWRDEDKRALIECLRGLLGSDYRQISDLGRFLSDDDPHFVR